MFYTYRINEFCHPFDLTSFLWYHVISCISCDVIQKCLQTYLKIIVYLKRLLIGYTSVKTFINENLTPLPYICDTCCTFHIIIIRIWFYLDATLDLLADNVIDFLRNDTNDEQWLELIMTKDKRNSHHENCNTYNMEKCNDVRTLLSHTNRPIIIKRRDFLKPELISEYLHFYSVHLNLILCICLEMMSQMFKVGIRYWWGRGDLKRGRGYWGATKG